MQVLLVFTAIVFIIGTPTHKGFTNFNKKRKVKMDKITKESVIGNILDADENTAKFFLEMGMHCLGCPCSRGETIEQACAVHGADADELVEKLNDYISKQGK